MKLSCLGDTNVYADIYQEIFIIPLGDGRIASYPYLPVFNWNSYKSQFLDQLQL